MAVQYKNADKLSRAKTALLGKGQIDSVETKAFQMCANEQDADAKLFCIYQKLGGAFAIIEDKAIIDGEETEEPKKRGRPAKAK